MNEVEKMYKNAGIEPVLFYDCESYNQKVEKGYLFTPEKQLDLIKKLGNINIDIDNGCYMSSEILEVEAHCDTFEETLAEFINNLWQDLTDVEKQQIKEILSE